MRTYICTECGERIVVGHPVALFRKQALALARGATSWLARLFRRGRTLARYIAGLEERYYLAPGRFRTVPRRCPHCGHRGEGGLPWWRPGATYQG